MTARADDPRRPIPPADIPSAAPVDLHAGALDEPARPHHTNVAEDMLLAAKSVFHSVIPQ
jgi:transposase